MQSNGILDFSKNCAVSLTCGAIRYFKSYHWSCFVSFMLRENAQLCCQGEIILPSRSSFTFALSNLLDTHTRTPKFGQVQNHIFVLLTSFSPPQTVKYNFIYILYSFLNSFSFSHRHLLFSHHKIPLSLILTYMFMFLLSTDSISYLSIVHFIRV